MIFAKKLRKILKTRFDISNFEIWRAKGKNKKIIGLKKDQLGEQILK